MDAGQNQKLTDTEKLREIPKWARKYAQNRTIPFLVSMVIFLLLFIAISVPSYLGGKAYLSGNMLAFWICIFFLVIACAALLFFSVPNWGSKVIERISRRIYGYEGVATLPPPARIKKYHWVGWVVGLAFASCVVGSVQLGIRGYIPIEYMQPVSALYVVPFLVFLVVWQRPLVSPLSLLWPIFYAIHAILIVTGMPILFTGNLIPLNMLLPTFGYGFLTLIIGHVYSRFALRKLKTLAKAQEQNGATGPEVN
jgi:uncharacterized membrane protein (DUF485 family)